MMRFEDRKDGQGLGEMASHLEGGPLLVLSRIGILSYPRWCDEEGQRILTYAP